MLEPYKVYSDRKRVFTELTTRELLEIAAGFYTVTDGPEVTDMVISSIAEGMLRERARG